jgi:hypothetical protein
MHSKRVYALLLLLTLGFSGCTKAVSPTALATLSPTLPLETTVQPTATSTLPPLPAATSTPMARPTQEISPTATATVEASNTPTVSPIQATATPATIATATSSPNASDCKNLAGFFGDVTIPDGASMKQGEQFTKTWRVRNEGTCTWGSGYALVFAWGELLGGSMSQPIPLAAPNEVIEISVDLTAPPAGGSYTGYWQIHRVMFSPPVSPVTSRYG